MGKVGQHANFVVMHAPPFRGKGCEGVELEWARKFVQRRVDAVLCGEPRSPIRRKE